MNASSICLHLADLLLNRRAISYWQQSDSCLHDVATRYLVWQVSTSQGLFHRFYDPQQRMTKHLLLCLASTIVTQSMQGSRRRLLTSCNECSMLPPVWSMTRGSLIVAWRQSSTMSFIGWLCHRGLPTRWVSWCTAVFMVRHLGTLPTISSRPPTSLLGFVCVLQTVTSSLYLAVISTHDRRAFLIAGPTVWNSLPDELRDPSCGSDSFKQFLKTILFSFY